MIGSYCFILLLLFSLWHTPPSTYGKILIVEVNKIKNTKDSKQKTVTKGQVNFTSSIGLRNVTCVGKWFHTLEDSGAVSGSENKSACATMIQGHPCIRFGSVHMLRGQKKRSALMEKLRGIEGRRNMENHPNNRNLDFFNAF